MQHTVQGHTGVQRHKEGTQGCKGTKGHTGRTAEVKVSRRSSGKEENARVKYTVKGQLHNCKSQTNKLKKGRVDAEGGKFKEMKMCCRVV